MFQIKVNEPSSSLRRIAVWLLDNATGKIPQAGVVPLAADITIYKAGGTIVVGNVGNWSAVANYAGLYTYILDMTDVDTPGSLSFRVTATGVRTFVKEMKVVTEVSGSGVYSIQQNESVANKRKLLCYLTDNATDLVPQTLVTAPTLHVLIPGSTAMVPASGTWTELANGLYHYAAAQAEIPVVGLMVLAAVSTNVRTFIKDIQVTAVPVEPPVTQPSLHAYRIPIVNELHVRAAYTQEPLSGRPKYACIRPKKIQDTNNQLADYNPDGDDRQGYQIMLYPVPDATYVLQYRYNRRKDQLSPSLPFPRGLHAHAETVLQSCLSVAEHRKTGQPGPQTARYKELLEYSREIDNKSELETADMMWPDELVVEADEGVVSDSSSPGYNFRTLVRDIGIYLGYGAHYRAWTHLQRKLVENRLAQAGYRTFLYPPIVRSIKNSQHHWSFLNPIYTVPVVANTTEYALPTNFGAQEGSVSLIDGNVGYSNVPIIGESRLRNMHELYRASTGSPKYVAFRPTIVNTTTAETGQQTATWKMIVFPTPDGIYSMSFKYRIDPFPLVAHNIVLFGAPIHSNTLTAACLAEAEIYKDGRHGPLWEDFVIKLEASIDFDQRAHAADYLGYNRDCSDMVSSLSRSKMRSLGDFDVTYGGVLYGG